MTIAPADPPAPASRAGRWRGPAVGVAAAGLALGAAELVAALIEVASPIVSVGNRVVDNVPVSLKTFAIDTFGTNDKPALIIGTMVLLALFAAAIGALAQRRRGVGWIGIGAFGIVGALAALRDVGAGASAALPSLLGACLAAVALDASLYERRPRIQQRDRRHFLYGLGATVAFAGAAGGLGRLVRRGDDVSGERAALALPSPAQPAAAIPDGAQAQVEGITSFFTPNADFYRIDTALTVPQVDPSTWRLTIGGMVDRELELGLDDLLGRRLVERDLTLVCVSNEVGGRLAGTARWLGVPLRELLEEAGVQDGADQLVSRSVDGYTAGTPTAAVLDRDALLAIGMNGEPLPTAHGFPARLVVPGLYGYVSATKWVTGLELTRFEDFDAYWVPRGYAKEAPVKPFARIDTPRGLASVPAGKTAVAGVAWATHRGVARVEVKVDEGEWRPATLAAAGNADTWRQWVFDWEATPGRHAISSRVVTLDGEVQTEERVPPLPDGATGWHQIVVLVG